MRRSILPLLVLSQFLCCSVWFTGNVVVSDMAGGLQLSPDFLGHIMSATQFGFITGTLIFALLSLSDLFSPSRIFFCSAVLAALFNLGITFPGIDGAGILLCRFFTGIFLAGIYPVGMKIASDYYKEGLGRSLGFLVGALVFGTAFPHLLKSLTLRFPPAYIVYTTTGLAVVGGLCVLLFIPDGPYRHAGQKLKITAFASGFRNKDFRTAAFGYFGHMWELYAFWTFLPVMLTNYNKYHAEAHLNVPLLSFIIIGIGGIACILSGLLSFRFGARPIATLALLLSCLCCLISPLFLFSSSIILLVIFLLVWGFMVIADSPLFSSLVARSAPAESRGTAITFVNCIGFLITIVSIEFISTLLNSVSPKYVYMLLAIGPVFGLINLAGRGKHSAAG